MTPPARLPLILLLALLPGIAPAQDAEPGFPSRPVTIVVPQAAGGPTDIESRIFAAKVAELLGQPFLVDNKTGAGTTIGTVHVAKSRPDGYTLLSIGGGFTSFEALYKEVPHQSTRYFAPISLVSQRFNVLVVPPVLPVRTLQEYFAHARANPGSINFATSGAGGGIHLAGAWMHGVSGTPVTFVHYKGTGALMQDLQAGRVQATSTGLLVSLPLIRAGKLRALAIMNRDRSDQLPDLATVAEQGIPGFNYSAWLGFAAPAGTPGATVDKLADGFIRATRAPDLVKRLQPEGSMVAGSTPAQFRQFMLGEVAQWRKVVQENAIKIEEP